MTRLCSVDGCEKRVRGAGLCPAHYSRLVRYGSPTGMPPPRERKTRLCSVNGCDREHNANGYCSKHDERFKKYGHPLAGPAFRQATPIPCAITGCRRKAHARGWCTSHYYRFLRNGSPTGGRAAPSELSAYVQSVVMNLDQDECHEWPYNANERGYGTINWKGETWPAHRLVCKLRNGAPPSPSHQAAHSCGNARCINPGHVRWATPMENSNDKYLHGTMLMGQDHGNAKLTEEGVRIIRSSKGRVSLRGLSERFGVTIGTVWSVQHYRSWKHVA